MYKVSALHTFKLEKRQYFPHDWPDYSFKGTVVNPCVT